MSDQKDFQWIYELAKGYKYRMDFRAAERNAYETASINGILDDVCKHMPKSRRIGVRKWRSETLIQEALKYQSLDQFEKQSPVAFDFATSAGLIEELTRIAFTERVKWTKKSIEKVASEYDKKRDFLVGNTPAYVAAENMGILASVTKHMGVNPNFIWNKETLAAEAAKYETKADFDRGSRSAYVTAHKQGIMDEITQHMKKGSRFTTKEAAEEAKKYASRLDFFKSSQSAYQVLVKAKMIDEACAHMEVTS